MLRSMTGYGRGEAVGGDVTVVIELKSVNNRFRDLQLRTPREYMVLEARINGMLKTPFTRGRIEAFVRRETTGTQSQVVTDIPLAAEYARAATEVASSMGDGVDSTVPLSYILSQPGVLDLREQELDVMTEWPVVEAALEAAVSDLMAMREAEGRALETDLRSHLGELQTLVAEVEAATVGINDRLRKRLENRIRRMIGDRFDPFRVVQEAAIQADKSDVAEELARLRSHCDQFAEALVASEAVGRRLDFLLQEMNREVNTIGSKAAEHPISHRVVAMKSTLERMREQSANVE